MIDRLPAWLFMAIAMTVIGIALLPVMRLLIGVDKIIGIQPLTLIMLLIAGLMSGLCAMLLLVKRQPQITNYSATNVNQAKVCTQLHASGLLLFTGIPLANFLVAYWLWLRHRKSHEHIDTVGQEVLNFQIAIYLYLLLALFLAFVIIGIFFIPILLIVHLALTLFASIRAFAGVHFKYPMNIPIIQGREKRS